LFLVFNPALRHGTRIATGFFAVDQLWILGRFGTPANERHACGNEAFANRELCV
jgi:hypothetical protein